MWRVSHEVDKPAVSVSGCAFFEFYWLWSIYVQRNRLPNQLDMNKLNTFILIALCVSLGVTKGSASQPHLYNTPVSPAKGQKSITLFDVRPHIDTLLKTQYWYYLRNANTIYEASVDSPLEYLYFTIYRNIVGTFLVITTWTK